MANEFMTALMPTILAWGKFFMFVFIIAIFVVLGIFLIINKRKRKWKVEIHEQKADGKLHTVGYDILEEKKLHGGTKTIYWLRKSKTETIPPPDECVNRFKGKEEVDYIRIERDFMPVEKKCRTNYNDPLVRKKVTNVYDSLRNKIRAVKTTYFDSEPVRDRFLYIPINKTLSANMNYKPIDYDMNMMAMNEIHNADEMFKSKYEFWKKYGAVIVFGLTIVFLIIIVVLTFDYIQTLITDILGRFDGVIAMIGSGTGGTPTPG